MNDAFVVAGLGAISWLAVAVSLLHTIKRSPALIVTGSAVLGYVVLVATAAAMPGSLSFWSLSAAYAVMTLSVLMLFGALYKSVSLRMLGDLSRIADHALPEHQLLAHYIEEDSFGRRIDILLEQGYAERAAAGLLLSTKGLRAAARIHLLQRAFAIRTSG